VKFLIDAMFPRRVAELLNAGGHDAIGPAELGAQNLPDDLIIQNATLDGRVIVTENWSDFAHVTCAVVFVRKSWWSPQALSSRLAAALDRWAEGNPDPGPWPHWLDAEFR
jgi:hypothetical protein